MMDCTSWILLIFTHSSHAPVLVPLRCPPWIFHLLFWHHLQIQPPLPVSAPLVINLIVYFHCVSIDHGHPHLAVLRHILANIKCSIPVNVLPSFCAACQFRKMHQATYPSTLLKTTKPFQFIHSNVWGPSPYPSIDGHRFYLSFVDDFTWFVWIFPLHLKYEVSSTIVHFIHYVERC